MTIQEIDDAIENCSAKDEQTLDVLRVLGKMTTKIAEMEAQLDRVDSAARHANNIASCLANGIQPD